MPEKISQQNSDIIPGGEGGIRTRGTIASTLPFQGSAFDHSATSPFNSSIMFIRLNNLMR